MTRHTTSCRYHACCRGGATRLRTATGGLPSADHDRRTQLLVGPGPGGTHDATGPVPEEPCHGRGVAFCRARRPCRVPNPSLPGSRDNVVTGRHPDEHSPRIEAQRGKHHPAPEALRRQLRDCLSESTCKRASRGSRRHLRQEESMPIGGLLFAPLDGPVRSRTRPGDRTAS